MSDVTQIIMDAPVPIVDLAYPALYGHADINAMLHGDAFPLEPSSTSVSERRSLWSVRLMALDILEPARQSSWSRADNYDFLSISSMYGTCLLSIIIFTLLNALWCLPFLASAGLVITLCTRRHNEAIKRNKALVDAKEIAWPTQLANSMQKLLSMKNVVVPETLLLASAALQIENLNTSFMAMAASISPYDQVELMRLSVRLDSAREGADPSQGTLVSLDGETSELLTRLMDALEYGNRRFDTGTTPRNMVKV